MEYLGISADQLPEIVECGEPVGKILPEVAEELGLPEDLLLVMGGQDQSSGAIGVGNVKPGIFSESTGGALMVCTTTEKPVLIPMAESLCNYSDMKDVYMIQGGAKAASCCAGSGIRSARWKWLWSKREKAWPMI